MENKNESSEALDIVERWIEDGKSASQIMSLGTLIIAIAISRTPLGGEKTDLFIDEMFAKEPAKMVKNQIRTLRKLKD